MRWITSTGMSRHASNGSGSTVSITGHLIVVVAIGSGAKVERSCTGSGVCTVSGPPCSTRITAVTSAPNAANRRILVAITPPRASTAPAGTIQVASKRPDPKREHVLVARRSGRPRASTLDIRGDTLGGQRPAYRSYRQQAGHRIAASVVAGRLADRRRRRRRAHRRDQVGTGPASEAVRQGDLGAG